MVIGNIYLKGHVNSLELQNFDLYAGDTKYINVDIVGEDGAPLSLTGCSFLWVAKKNVKGKNIIQKTLGNGIEIADVIHGKIRIRLDSYDTQKLSNDYYHEVELTDNEGNVSTVSSGTMSVVLSGANAAGISQLPPDIEAPLNVTGLNYDNLTPNSVRLVWNASTSRDTTGYYIYNGPNWLSTVLGTAANIVGLTPLTNYTFIVKARDGSGNVSSGAYVTVKTPDYAPPPDTVPPSDVNGLNSSDVTTTSFKISWTASSSADINEYDIYVGADFLATTTMTEYTFSGMNPATTYVITVKSVDTSGNTSNGSSISVTTTAVFTDTIDGGGFTDTITTTVDGGDFTTAPTGEAIDGGEF